MMAFTTLFIAIIVIGVLWFLSLRRLRHTYCHQCQDINWRMLATAQAVVPNISFEADGFAALNSSVGWHAGSWLLPFIVSLMSTPTRLHKAEPFMRLLVFTIFILNSVAQCVYAKPPELAQQNSASNSSRAVLQEPFHMPVSERKIIADFPSWTAPQKPFRIYGNTWYVGPHGLGVFLVTAPTGHVLIDSGVPGDATLIEANIRDLGIDLLDIKWILNTHAHFDHAGGIVQLAHDTGAQIIASAVDGSALERGGRDDPEYGDKFPFPPVRVARTMKDGEPLQLGGLVLTAHATPRHTKGNMTLTWMSCEGKRCLHMVDIGSLSAPGYKLIGSPKYPSIVDDFEHSFAIVAALPCDIALAPHPDVVSFWTRVNKRKSGDANAMVDPSLCQVTAKDARENLKVQLAKQRAVVAVPK